MKNQDQFYTPRGISDRAAFELEKRIRDKPHQLLPWSAGPFYDSRAMRLRRRSEDRNLTVRRRGR